MTHHMMNQMAHEFPNMIGVKRGDVDRKVRLLLPGYMTMGKTGPFSYIDMGGMTTIVKVRDELASYDEDPCWYQHPAGTVGSLASADELRRDGIA